MVLHVILLIFKIIGIILLIILGLILLLLSILLFVPIRYYVDGICNGDVKSLEAKIHASWLLHLAAFHLQYVDQNLQGFYRIAWLKEPIGKEKKYASSPKKEKPEKKETIKPTEERVEKPAEKVPVKPAEEISVKPAEEIPVKPAEEISVKPVEKVRKEEKEAKKNQFIDKIREIFRKIKYTFKKIYDKIKLLGEKKDHAMEFKDDPIHRNAWFLLWKETGKLLKRLKPKKLKANLVFGLEDPYRTGQVLAVLGMMYPFLGKNMKVDPDFEEQILEGNIHIKGKIRMIHLLKYVVRLLLSKDVRTSYHDIKEFQL